MQHPTSIWRPGITRLRTDREPHETELEAWWGGSEEHSAAGGQKNVHAMVIIYGLEVKT